jgi:hypothetical protein
MSQRRETNDDTTRPLSERDCSPRLYRWRLRRHRLLQSGVRRGGAVQDGPSQRQNLACRDLDLRLGGHDRRPRRQVVWRAPGAWRCTASLHIFLDDNAALLRRAVEAGAEEIQPPTDMFYGASSASVRDPFGHVWVLLSWKEDLDPAEMERRGREFLGRLAKSPEDGKKEK